MGVGRSVGMGLAACVVLAGCQEMTFQNPFRALTPEEQASNPNTAPPPGALPASPAVPPPEPVSREAAPAAAVPGGESAPAAVPAPAEAPSTALVPLPRDLALLPPSGGAPSELARFWGIWRGEWTGGVPHVLVVESVDAAAARVVVAWGDAPGWDMQKGWERHSAPVADGVLTVRTSRPGTITYRMRDARAIEARYEWDGGSATATLRQ